MEDNRIVELQDKRGTKDCPNLFANIVMKTINTMATVSGKSHRKLSITGISLAEAVSLHEQLGELLSKDNETMTQEAEKHVKDTAELKADEAKKVAEDNMKVDPAVPGTDKTVKASNAMGKSEVPPAAPETPAEPKQDFSGVKTDGDTESVESDKQTEQKVETQEQTKVQEKGSKSEGQPQTSQVRT